MILFKKIDFILKSFVNGDRRKIGIKFVTVIISIFLLLLIALITRKEENNVREICECIICVAKSGFHTDLIVPAENSIYSWQEFIVDNDVNKDRQISYRYLSFGWGDRAFFMKSPTQLREQLSLGFKALFLPTPSVMRVQSYPQIPQHLEVKCTEVSRIGYLKLVEFIETSFQLDQMGRKIPIATEHHSQTRFYAAIGTYSLLRHCNSWTAEGLHSAFINTPFGSGFSSSTTFHLNKSCESQTN